MPVTLPPAPPLPPLEQRFFDVGGVRLHAVLAGPEEGPLVVLLHGFPELWYGWKHQIGPLAAAGLRVLVPDQRGYNLSDRPRGLSAYTQDVLARDVLGLMDAMGRKRAMLVGHDWGGAVAWWTTLQHPERVERLAVLNIPHPAVFARALRTPEQLKKSWYIAFFQLPWLPEYLLGRAGARRLVGLMRRGTREGVLSRADLEIYRQAYLRPAALRAMLAWYRAAVRRPLGRPRTGRPEQPVLLVWGKEDIALGWEMARPSIERCARGRLKLVEGAGHFVQHDAWPTVNEELLGFLTARP